MFTCSHITFVMVYSFYFLLVGSRRNEFNSLWGDKGGYVRSLLLARKVYHPEEKDDILNFIKKNNLKRLLKKDIQGQELTDEVLLNPKNYYNKWYRPEVKDISDIVQKLTNNGNHPEITNIKHSYDRFCAYKHYAPYVMMPRYGTSMNIPNCDEFLAISISLQCLYITFMYVNLYQFNKTDIQDITHKYSRLTDFCPIR